MHILHIRFFSFWRKICNIRSLWVWGSILYYTIQLQYTGKIIVIDKCCKRSRGTNRSVFSVTQHQCFPVKEYVYWYKYCKHKHIYLLSRLSPTITVFFFKIQFLKSNCNNKSDTKVSTFIWIFMVEKIKSSSSAGFPYWIMQ